jgi:hypothetical protein
MKSKFLLLNLLISSLLTAQNWNYVGNTSVTGNTVTIKTHGSAETVFKTDGTPISVCMNGNTSSSGPHILPKTFNGSSWVNLGAITTTGNIGAIDTEIYNNEPYVAYLETGALRVKKYDGTNWINVGSNLPGYTSSLNFDFAIDNTGGLYVACNDRKIFKFNGTAWSLVFTLPQTAGSTTYIYQFVGDNTLTFDSNNHLVYNVSSNTFPSSIYKQFVKKYNGTVESIVGDTILYNAGYTNYGAKIYSNSLNEIFSFFHKAITNNVVMKKFNGTNWINFGDTLNFRKNLAQSCIAFTSNNSFIISGTGQGRNIYTCNSQTSGFQLIDTLNVSGLNNFAQITDLSINPINNDIYATFNSFPTSIQDYSVMNHGALTTDINIQMAELINIELYPNPNNGVFTVQANFENAFDVMVYNNIGQLVKEVKELKGVNQIDMSGYAQGIYNIVLRVNDNYKTIKMVIE